jgi:hypothetical protein
MMRHLRVPIAGVVLLFVTSTAAAQSRWTFSAGPEWTGVAPKTYVWGMRLRAEYDLTRPARIFGLRLEGAALWSPTQSYFNSGSSPGYTYSLGGTEQRADLMLGVTGSFSPLPRARFAPYATMGIYGRQQWTYGSRFYNSSLTGSYGGGPPSTMSRGDIIGAVGLGLRMRIAGHAFQLEYRRIHGSSGLTFGTRLPF